MGPIDCMDRCPMTPTPAPSSPAAASATPSGPGTDIGWLGANDAGWSPSVSRRNSALAYVYIYIYICLYLSIYLSIYLYIYISIYISALA